MEREKKILEGKFLFQGMGLGGESVLEVELRGPLHAPSMEPGFSKGKRGWPEETFEWLVEMQRAARVSP